MNWFTRLWSSAPAKPPAAVRSSPARSVAVPAAAPVQAAQPVPPDLTEVPFLPWLPTGTSPSSAALSPAEQSALDVLDPLLARATLPDSMLPRAAELVPKLISLLRESDLPLHEMAQRVSRDAVLTAEVMRIASSPYYRIQGEVTDLFQAIRLIGASGLQTAIARVVLKPICRDAHGPISPDLAARLWAHSEELSERLATLAGAAGHSRFDGYLIGMLHDTGWRVALHALGQVGNTPGMQPSGAFAGQLTERVHRLFGLAAQGWTITPTFTALVNDARHNGLAGGQHPLVPILQHALYLCAGPCAPEAANAGKR